MTFWIKNACHLIKLKNHDIIHGTVTNAEQTIDTNNNSSCIKFITPTHIKFNRNCFLQKSFFSLAHSDNSLCELTITQNALSLFWCYICDSSKRHQPDHSNTFHCALFVPLCRCCRHTWTWVGDTILCIIPRLFHSISFYFSSSSRERNKKKTVKIRSWKTQSR